MKATLVKKGLDDCKFCSSNGKSTQRRFEKHRFDQGSTISLSPKAGHFWKEKSKSKMKKVLTHVELIRWY